MANQNDDQFEMELKQFRPLAPDPILIQKVNRPIWHKLVGMASIAAAAIIAIVLWSALEHLSPLVPTASVTSQLVNAQPLTLGRSNALLAASPSFKAALDAMSFQAQPAPVAQDKRSAIAELSKERIKL